MGATHTIATDVVGGDARISNGTAPLHIVVAGSGRVGKSSLLWRMQNLEAVFHETEYHMMMMDFYKRPFTNKQGEPVKVMVWGHSGRERFNIASNIRRMCARQGANVAIAFVVDSADKNALAESKQELHKVFLTDPVILEKAIPIMVLANKQDKEKAMTLPSIAEELGIHQPGQPAVFLRAVSAKTGQGLSDALDDIAQILLDRAGPRVTDAPRSTPTPAGTRSLARAVASWLTSKSYVALAQRLL